MFFKDERLYHDYMKDELYKVAEMLGGFLLYNLTKEHKPMKKKLLELIRLNLIMNDSWRDQYDKQWNKIDQLMDLFIADQEFADQETEGEEE